LGTVWNREKKKEGGTLDRLKFLKGKNRQLGGRLLYRLEAQKKSLPILRKRRAFPSLLQGGREGGRGKGVSLCALGGQIKGKKLLFFPSPGGKASAGPMCPPGVGGEKEGKVLVASFRGVLGGERDALASTFPCGEGF